MKGSDIGKWAYHMICLLRTKRLFRPPVERNNNLASRVRLSFTTPAPTSFATEVHDETHPSASTRKSHVERYDFSASSDTFLQVCTSNWSTIFATALASSRFLFAVPFPKQDLPFTSALMSNGSRPINTQRCDQHDGASRPTRASKTKSKNQTNATNQMK